MRALGESAQLGAVDQCLVLSGSFAASDATDPAASAPEARGRKAVEAMPQALAGLPRLEVPLLAFAHTVGEGQDGFVVLDTAPTGHTLLLLDAAESHHHDVARTASDMPVTLPEATPVHEAARLQEDLLRAGIKPFARAVNQSFAGDGLRDPVLKERGSREMPFISEVRNKFAVRMSVIPWAVEAPVGPERLMAFVQSRMATA